MTLKQTTIRKAVSVSGVGLHTGVTATLTFKPAPENHWYKFQRVDLPNKPIIDVDVDNVVDTSRGTTLMQHGAKVSTTEHALAALVGLQIDNVIIEIDGPEVPIMDGSSRPFLEALEQAGIVEQNAPKNIFVLNENLSYE